MKAILCAAVIMVAVSPVSSKNGDEPVLLRAKDANHAATMKLSEENRHARICIRHKQLGSRVKYRRICMRQHEWKSYLDALDEMNDDWDNAAKGRVIK